MRVGRVLAAAARREGEVAVRRTTSQDAQYSLEGSGDLYQPKSALEYIAAVPPRVVQGNRARCDGGGGALGHPAVYINLNLGTAACGYCGLRFKQDDHHH